MSRQTEFIQLASALMEHFLEGSALLRLWYAQLKREYLYLLLFSFVLMYQCLNGAIPSRKRSIKAPAKSKNSIYVLTEICLQ